LNAVNDELGNLVADYIYDAFIESGLVSEYFDTAHNDVTENPHLFPLVHAVLKLMNPSVQMFYDTRVEYWGSRRGEARYHAAFMWDSRVPWYIPREIFGSVCERLREAEEEGGGDQRDSPSEAPQRILKDDELVDTWEMKEYLHPKPRASVF
jgi:hypothetical protein